MLSSRETKRKSPRTPRTRNSPRSPVFIDMGSLDTSPTSPQASRRASPAKWATAVRQSSPQAARRASPAHPLPPPPSYETTVGVNGPLYSMRSSAAIAASHAHAKTSKT